jgi:uncharacterized protein YceK
MARNVVAACVAAVLLEALSGCGTVMNLTEEQSPTYGMSTSSKPRSPYGGVGYDLDLSQWLLLAGPRGLAESACLIADVPLSLAGDTLTLPYVLYLRAHKDKPADVPPKTLPVEQAKYTAPPPPPTPRVSDP